MGWAVYSVYPYFLSLLYFLTQFNDSIISEKTVQYINSGTSWEIKLDNYTGLYSHFAWRLLCILHKNRQIIYIAIIYFA